MEMEKPLFWFTSEVSMTNNGDDDALENQVETDMAKDEVKKFEEDWINLWNPDITKNEIEKLHL